MTLGNILLQPQISTRFSEINFDQSLMDDVISIFQKLSMNPELRESLLSHIEPYLESFISELTAHIESNMTAAQSEMSGLVEGLVGAFSELTNGNGQLETVGDVLQFLLDLVDKFASFIESLDISKIKNWLSKVFDILFETLGFNSEFLQQKFCQLVDIVVAALETIPDGASTEHIEFQLQISLLLKRIKREVLKDIPELNFNADRLAQMLLDQLRELGLETIQEKAQCLAGKVRGLVDAGTSIYDLAKVIENDSVGAVRRTTAVRTGKKYCWYASWLYQNRRRSLGWIYFGTYLFPMVPKDEVWISEDGKKLILRHATPPGAAGEVTDEILYESSDGSDIKWSDAPQFSSTAYGNENFSFTNTLSPEFLEDWTIALSSLVYFAKMTGHIIHATEPRNHITHSILSAWNLTRLIGSATTLTPFTSWVRDKFGWGTRHRAWIDIFFQWLPIIAASFEGFHSEQANDRGKLWMTLIGDDAYDCFLIHLWPTMVHEGMLSIFTLINQKGPAYTDFKDDGKPRNHEYSFPLTNVWLVFFSWLQSRVALDRKDYSHPFESTHLGPFMLNWLLYSWMFGALAGITGELTGWAISRSVSPRRLLQQLGWGAYKGWGMYLVTHYFWNEGDTDGGRYNPTNAFADGPAFPGYPDHNTSPYRLPVAGGEPIFVGQAHQGMFSHFVDGTGTIQVYATDFAHDFQQMITAIRDGVVVDFDESQIDSNTTTWNYITIMHSNPNGTETADNLAHDIDQAGAPTPVTTYAVYGHGAQNGVSAAFNPRGITTPNIIGTVVNRGDNIMQAGDTGVSFHNHLHLHVRTGPAPVSPVVRVTPGNLSTYTIPIVFGDASHPLKGKGRLKFLTWYRSGNA